MKGSLSAIVGIMKVYPALAKYVSSEGIHVGAVTEIYDVPNKKIIYRQKIITDKQ